MKAAGTGYDPSALLFTVSHAARFMGVSRATFWAMRIAPGFPPPVSVPGVGNPMYRRADLEAMVAGLEPRAKSPRPRANRDLEEALNSGDGSYRP